MRAGRDSARTVPDPWFMKSLGSKANGPRLERMMASPRWAGEGFRNRHPILPGLRDPTAPMPTWSDFLCAQERGIPARALPALDPLETWRRRPGSGLRVTWLGHSTVLLEIDGARVLTDPVWGARASPLRLRRAQAVPAGAGADSSAAAARRGRDLARPLRPPRLPDDPRAARSATCRSSPRSASARTSRPGASPPERITELDWWERTTRPGRGAALHRGALAALLRAAALKIATRTLWSSFVVRGGAARVFFSGDTGLTPSTPRSARASGPSIW